MNNNDTAFVIYSIIFLLTVKIRGSIFEAEDPSTSTSRDHHASAASASSPSSSHKNLYNGSLSHRQHPYDVTSPLPFSRTRISRVKKGNNVEENRRLNCGVSTSRIDCVTSSVIPHHQFTGAAPYRKRRITGTVPDRRRCRRDGLGLDPFKGKKRCMKRKKKKMIRRKNKWILRNGEKRSVRKRIRSKTDKRKVTESRKVGNKRKTEYSDLSLISRLSEKENLRNTYQKDDESFITVIQKHNNLNPANSLVDSEIKPHRFHHPLQYARFEKKCHKSTCNRSDQSFCCKFINEIAREIPEGKKDGLKGLNNRHSSGVSKTDTDHHQSARKNTLKLGNISGMSRRNVRRRKDKRNRRSNIETKTTEPLTYTLVNPIDRKEQQISERFIQQENEPPVTSSLLSLNAKRKEKFPHDETNDDDHKSHDHSHYHHHHHHHHQHGGISQVLHSLTENSMPATSGLKQPLSQNNDGYPEYKISNSWKIEDSPETLTQPSPETQPPSVDYSDRSQRGVDAIRSTGENSRELLSFLITPQWTKAPNEYWAKQHSSATGVEPTDPNESQEVLLNHSHQFQTTIHSSKDDTISTPSTIHSGMKGWKSNYSIPDLLKPQQNLTSTLLQSSYKTDLDLEYVNQSNVDLKNTNKKDIDSKDINITFEYHSSPSLANMTAEEDEEGLSFDEDLYLEDLLEKIMMNMTTYQRRPPDSRRKLPLLDTAGSVRIPCYVVIFLLGVIGNSLVIITLLQHRKMRTITNVFLLNLAVSDLLLGVFCMPFTLVGSLLRDFIFGAIMCRLIPFFQGISEDGGVTTETLIKAVSVSVSVWTLVAISLERYYAICQPLRSRGWQTLSHAYKIISLVWILSLIFMAPIAALSQLHPIGSTNRNKCRETWPSLHVERAFSMFLGIGLLMVPLLIMTVAYSSITVTLWHGMKLERETGQGTQPLISMTDLNSLAMVQKSLQQKQQSKRHASKISIRFRKIPAQNGHYFRCEQTDNCSREGCGSCSKDLTPSSGFNEVRGRGGGGGGEGEGGGGGEHPGAMKRKYSDIFKWHFDSNSKSQSLQDSPNRKGSQSTSFKRLRSTHLEKSIEAKKHVIKMLFVVVLEFFVCWTPIFVVNIMCLYLPEQVYRTLGSFGISFLHLLSYASSCCNPITYCFMNRKFLQGFRHAFGCRKDTDRIVRQNGTAASFRSQSHNALKIAIECKKDVRETTV